MRHGACVKEVESTKMVDSKGEPAAGTVVLTPEDGELHGISGIGITIGKRKFLSICA